MIHYSSYFFDVVCGSRKGDPTWIKADRMLNDYQWATKDLKEAISWAKIVSLSCGVIVEVLQQEYHIHTGEKSWWCIATVSGTRSKRLL